MKKVPFVAGKVVSGNIVVVVFARRIQVNFHNNANLFLKRIPNFIQGWKEYNVLHVRVTNL